MWRGARRGGADVYFTFTLTWTVGPNWWLQHRSDAVMGRAASRPRERERERKRPLEVQNRYGRGDEPSAIPAQEGGIFVAGCDYGFETLSSRPGFTTIRFKRRFQPGSGPESCPAALCGIRRVCPVFH